MISALVGAPPPATHLFPIFGSENGSQLGLWNRILKSLIKVGYPSRFKSFLSDFLQGDSPCSCGHFEMRLNTVGPLVPEL